MSGRKNIFPRETELSEIVLRKTDQAFAPIRRKESGFMRTRVSRTTAGRTTAGRNKAREDGKRTATGRNRVKADGRRRYHGQAAAIAGICILAFSSISAAAALHFYWGRGMNGNLQATDTQQQELTVNGVAKVYRDEPDYAALAVTNNGVTIVPDTVVADERYAYLSFRISGYSIESAAEQGIERVDIYPDREDVDDEVSAINMYGGSMYDGIITDISGKPVYEDGSPIAYDEEGRTIYRYTDENGDMEYIIQAGIADRNSTLLGKTIHVELHNLGYYSDGTDADSQKNDFVTKAEGDWNFEITFPNVSLAKDITVAREVEGTAFTIESISISPVSLKADYSVSEAPETWEDENGIPRVMGVVFKDGTRIPYLTDGGGSGYTDESRTHAYYMAGYDRVIDVDEVAALLVQTSSGGELQEIEISIL